MAIRTQQLLNSGRNIIGLAKINSCNVQNHCGRWDLRNVINGHATCCAKELSYRSFYTTGEPRSTLAKLSPQEIGTVIRGNFSYPDCTDAGVSCLNCTSQKLCVSMIFFNIYFSDTACAEDTPYCNPVDNQCTSIKPDNCSAIVGYGCPLSDGVFPSTTNCSRYYVCDDSISTTYSCDASYVYNQTFGKCLIQLTDDACEENLCSESATDNVYPGYPTLYYNCSGTEATLASCPEGYYFNLETNDCVSLCGNSSDPIPNTVDCTTYFSCALSGTEYVPTKQTCDGSKGFNQVAKSCQNGYNVLCNELAIIERDIDEVLDFISFVKFFLSALQGVLNFFSWNIATLLVNVVPNTQIISDVIITADYIYTEQTLPAPFVKVLVNSVVALLPEPYATVLQLVLQVTGMAKRDLSSAVGHVSKQRLVETLTEKLSSIEIDVKSILIALNNKSLPEIEDLARDKTLEVFDLTPSGLADIFRIAGVSYDSVATDLNRAAGGDVLKSTGDNVRFNIGGLCFLFKPVYKEKLNILYSSNYELGTAVDNLVSSQIPCIN